MDRTEEKQELLVFVCNRTEQSCSECGTDLYRGDLIVLEGDAGIRCLACSDLDHLVYLPAGNAALSRRARKDSNLCAVVLQYSRSRKRNERQGLLVEKEAIELAEEQCLADEEIRKRRREREAIRREKLDAEYVARFAEAIRIQYPGCPAKRENVIAEHACLKHSGRVGRSGSAKAFAPATVDLAVRAHIRHVETEYDSLLSQGIPRDIARREVAPEVEQVARQWGD